MENGNQAPAADAGGGAPAAPQAPPAAPAAPATPAPADSSQQAPNAAEQADAGEWDEAVDELFPGIRTANKGAKKNEPTDPNKATTTPEAPAKGQEGDQPPKPDGQGEAEGDGENAEEDEQPDFSGRDARVAQREYQQHVDSVKADVRAKLYADVPKTLQDADGDPIRGIEDVMKLINPRTITAEAPEGRTFTEEEAGMWLLSAQQQFNKNMENLDKRIDQIAEVNVDIGEQADVIKYKYGELLKVLPDPDNPKKLYRDTLWEDYQNTLKTDPNTNVILEAPVSLERFYERALAPYAKMAQEAEQNNSSAPPATPAAPAADPNANRTQVRNDRSDIFGGTNPNEGQSEDDKEWGAAIADVFPQLNKK